MRVSAFELNAFVVGGKIQSLTFRQKNKTHAFVLPEGTGQGHQQSQSFSTVFSSVSVSIVNLSLEV